MDTIMKKQKLIEIYKNGTDYGLIIPKNTSGKDVEIGLATAIHEIANHQRTIDPNFKTETLIEAVKGWVRCLS